MCRWSEFSIRTRLAVAIPLLMTLNLNYVIKRAFAGEHHKCPINNYHDGDGDYCIECPAGYFGVNCTNICPPLYYGIMCLQKCDCSTCHHVQGCISTTRIPVEILGTTSHKCVSKDEIKDTTKTQGTNEHKYYFVSCPYTRKTIFYYMK
nr:uncharacterized protein LOC105323993 [Crassostrea gigas]